MRVVDAGPETATWSDMLIEALIVPSASDCVRKLYLACIDDTEKPAGKKLRASDDVGLETKPESYEGWVEEHMRVQVRSERTAPFMPSTVGASVRSEYVKRR